VLKIDTIVASDYTGVPKVMIADGVIRKFLGYISVNVSAM